MAGEGHGRGMGTACYVWISLYAISLRLIVILSNLLILCMPHRLFPSGLPTRTLCPMHCPSPQVRNMPPPHYDHLDLYLINGLILVWKYKEWSNLENNNFEDEQEDGHIFKVERQPCPCRNSSACPSKRAATDIRLRPRGPRNRQLSLLPPLCGIAVKTEDIGFGTQIME